MFSPVAFWLMQTHIFQAGHFLSGARIDVSNPNLRKKFGLLSFGRAEELSLHVRENAYRCVSC